MSREQPMQTGEISHSSNAGDFFAICILSFVIKYISVKQRFTDGVFYAAQHPPAVLCRL
jgi:hypothetical protein